MALLGTALVCLSYRRHAGLMLPLHGRPGPRRLLGCLGYLALLAAYIGLSARKGFGMGVVWLCGLFTVSVFIAALTITVVSRKGDSAST